MVTTEDILAGLCHPQDACLLFTRLPAELRTCIYECVLIVQPDDEHGSVRLIRHLPGEHAPLSVLTLLETCRLIHNEALGIFFQQNRFRLSFRTSLAAGAAPRIPFPYVSPSRSIYIHDLLVNVASFGSIELVCRLLARQLPALYYLRIVLRDVYDHYNDGPDRDRELLKEFVEDRESFKLAVTKLRGPLKEFHLIWEDFQMLEHQEPRGWRDCGEELSRETGMSISLSRRGPVKLAVS
ncbi:hypothetical protein DOTSEDRAFT_25550 [Dothistroma septosporum NZE10]|uniref:F-box domain-containing protein n=1 Tax=Dothistroma septosporum (strain NZE10 / CBS 128990) TaxID=675120 RepID=M2Y5U8_DOTSN|nr:hypothetical protein DOTSEDRAFT_25550 [Dothistroma septosporum NZE10]